MQTLESGTLQINNLNVLDDSNFKIKNLNLNSISGNFHISGSGSVVTPSSDSNTNQIATTAFVQNKIDDLVGTAPGTLNTLGEIATSLGTNTNLSTTLTNLVNEKAPLASPNFIGIPQAPTALVGTSTSQIATTAFVKNTFGILNNVVTSLTEKNTNLVKEPSDLYAVASDNLVLPLSIKPIVEYQEEINELIFTDSGNNTVSQDFLNNSEKPISGKIYYYSSDGTEEYPIDGTNGNGINGLSKVGTPVICDVSDSSGYSNAIAKTYRYAPSVGPNGEGGSSINLQISKGIEPLFTKQVMINGATQVQKYYRTRGYNIPSPNYDPVTDYNFFHTLNSIDYSTFQIEFVYENGAIPSAAYVLGYSLNYSKIDTITGEGAIDVGSGPKSVCDRIPHFRPGVLINITTDFFDYSSKVANGVNTIFYDTKKHHILVNLVQEDIWNDTRVNTFYSKTVKHILNKFKGSLAIVKITDQENFTECLPSDPDCFLMVISPTFVIQDKLFINDILINDKIVTLNNSVSFKGLCLTRPGYGKIGTLITTTPYYKINSYNLQDKVITPPVLNKNWGDNPYSTIYEPMSATTFIQEWLNEDWPKVMVLLDQNVFRSSTPETLKQLPSSFCQNVENDNSNTLILLHEFSHAQQTIDQAIYVGNSEGYAVCHELDCGKYLNGQEILLRGTYYFSTFINCSSKGWIPMNFGSQWTYNNIYSQKSLGLPTDNAEGEMGTYSQNSTQYAEGLCYYYIKSHYDESQQIIRRVYELSSLVYKTLKENGITNVVQKDVGGINRSLYYAQALYEIAGVSINNVYTDYCVAEAFLRNNASIPSKYHIGYPYWLWSEHNQFSTLLANKLKSTNSNYLFTKLKWWSELDESNPINYIDVYKQVIYDGESIIPFWPRSFSDLNAYKLGSWNRSVTPNVWVPSSRPYATSRTIKLEDLAHVTFILPVAGNTGLGVSSVMTSMSIQVNRGDWAFTVVQFVPDGNNGTWTQLPSNGNYYNINVPGLINTNNILGWENNSTPVTQIIDLTNFSVNVYNGKSYYPKLVCVNKSLNNYGEITNIFPNKSRYSGEIILTPTFI
jgi:hypothetical protein